MKAEIFAMPAMSPTMNEGGVTEWKLKEGDSFSSGDILLEVETDKSQIDVEAQDDGILAKIIKSDGTKDIPVGEAIAIIAEPGDDLATLELPEIKSKSATKEEPKKEEAPAPKKEESAPASKKSSPSTSPSETSSSTEADPKQIFSPSVAGLLEANNISKEDALSKIKASGPNGRILKGDVLAHLGRITQDSVSKVSNFVNSQKQLDLSNIERLKIAPKEIAKESESIKKQEKPKKEAKVFNETFNLSNLEASAEDFASEKGINFDLTQYIKEASKRSEQYAYQRQEVASDYYDPVFEDLVSLPTNLERFTIELDIKAPKPSVSFGGETSDLLDLVDSKPTTTQEPSVSVKVTVNPKVADAEEKANAYLSKFRNYINETGFF